MPAISQVVQNMFAPVISFIWLIFWSVVGFFFASVFLFFAAFFLLYRVTPNTTMQQLEAIEIGFKPYSFMRWFMYDWKKAHDGSPKLFEEYGFTLYCGRQGAGKTVSMIEYLERMRVEYPNVLIVTNFSYAHAYQRMDDWRDLFEIRNGTDGVIFAIDEIHSEYSSASWKDFPESILSEISQQRKQRIKIVATAQVFGRVAKPIREQTASVVMCSTYARRWTFCKEYDAAEYSVSDTPYTVKGKIRPLRRYSFVQTNELRSCFDTYEKIERLQRTEFIPRNERDF